MKSFKPIILFVTVSFILNMGSSIYNPIYPYYVLDLKIDMTTYGLIDTVSNIVNILMRIPYSTLLPTIGYFKSYMIGYIMMGFSGIFYAYALFSYPLILFTIARILSAGRFTIMGTARSSIITRLAEYKRRALFLGLVSSLSLIASSIGPFIGSYLYENLGLGYYEIFLLSISLVIPGIFPLIYLIARYEIKEKVNGNGFREQVRSIPIFLKNRDMLKIFLIFQIDAFSWSISHGYYNIYIADVLKGLPIELAYINLIMNVTAIIGFIVTGYLSDRFRRRVIFIFFSEIAGIIFLSIFLSAKNVSMMYPAWIFMSFVWFLWSPTTTAYITEKTEEIDPTKIPLVLGIWGFLSGVARTPASLIGGILYDINPRYPFITTLILIIFVSIIILTLKEPSKVK